MNISESALMQYDNSKISKYKNMNAERLNPSNKELYNVCKDFEEIFVKQMLDSMKKTVDKSSSVIQSSTEMNYFEDMLYDSYAKKITETANLGIAKMMYMQLYKTV